MRVLDSTSIKAVKETSDNCWGVKVTSMTQPASMAESVLNINL